MSDLGTDLDLASALEDATRSRTGLPGRSVVALALDGEESVVEIVDGRVSMADEEAEAAVTVPLTSRQLASFLAGDDSLARAYMRGDVKPVGSSGALLAVVEVLEDDEVRARLAASGRG